MEVILIPCSKTKRRGGEFRPPEWSPLQDLLMPATWRTLASLRLELARALGLELGSDLDPAGEADMVRLLPAYQRYQGRLFRAAGLEDRWPLPSDCSVLVVSALYGLVNLGDDLRDYELKMVDRLPDHMPVWRWWQERGLGFIVAEAVRALEPGQVDDLLTPHYRKAVEARAARALAPTVRLRTFPGLGMQANAARGRELGSLLDRHGRHAEPEVAKFALAGVAFREPPAHPAPEVARPEGAERGAPRRADFEAVLGQWLSRAETRGEPYTDIRAGDLHQAVGGLEAREQRMPVCCGVMRRAMRRGDRVLRQPPGGNGANVVIRYNLPRPAEGEAEGQTSTTVPPQGPIPLGARGTLKRLRGVSRASVLRAIEECDQKGRDRFCAEHGFGRAYKFPLEHEGREYDSKAILGVAYGYEFPERGPLGPHELNGGLSMTVPVLEGLGFKVQRAGRAAG
jgi:cytoplasmic iron level regulating protein YaaA (DUF328/UPF0246 family)